MLHNLKPEYKLLISSLLLLTLISFPGKSAYSGGKPGKLPAGIKSINSGITGPRKPKPLTNDIKPSNGFNNTEELKNTIDTDNASELKNNVLQLKQNTQEMNKNITGKTKEITSNTKEKSTEIKNRTHLKTEELRLKINEKKTGEQKTNFEKLTADINSIKIGSTVTSEMKNKLAQDLKTTLSSANMPSNESLVNFCDTFTNAACDQKITPSEAIKLAEDIDAVLNSSGISPEEIQAIITDAETIIEAADISSEEKQALKNDIKTIAAASKTNAEAVKSLTEKTNSGAVQIETYKSGDNTNIKESLNETRLKIEKIKNRKNEIREQIKNIKNTNK